MCSCCSTLKKVASISLLQSPSGPYSGAAPGADGAHFRLRARTRWSASGCNRAGTHSLRILGALVCRVSLHLDFFCWFKENVCCFRWDYWLKCVEQKDTDELFLPRIQHINAGIQLVEQIQRRNWFFNWIQHYVRKTEPLWTKLARWLNQLLIYPA